MKRDKIRKHLQNLTMKVLELVPPSHSRTFRIYLFLFIHTHKVSLKYGHFYPSESFQPS